MKRLIFILVANCVEFELECTNNGRNIPNFTSHTPNATRQYPDTKNAMFSETNHFPYLTSNIPKLTTDFLCLTKEMLYATSDIPKPTSQII